MHAISGWPEMRQRDVRARSVFAVVLLVLAGCGEKPPTAEPAKDATGTKPVERASTGGSTKGGEPAPRAAGADFKKWEAMVTSDDYQAQLEGAGKFNRLAMARAQADGTVSDRQAGEAVVSIKGLLNDQWGKLGGSLETLTLAMIYLDENDLKETRAVLKGHKLPHVRMQIVKSLGKRANPKDKTYYLGLFAQNDPKVESAVKALVEVLNVDGEPDVREQAALMLGHIGPEAKSALPALGEVLKDEAADPRVRVAAGVAAGKIAEKPSP